VRLELYPVTSEKQSQFKTIRPLILLYNTHCYGMPIYLELQFKIQIELAVRNYKLTSSIVHSGVLTLRGEFTHACKVMHCSNLWIVWNILVIQQCNFTHTLIIYFSRRTQSNNIQFDQLFSPRPFKPEQLNSPANFNRRRITVNRQHIVIVLKVIIRRK
jgi:hypothetical protein